MDDTWDNGCAGNLQTRQQTIRHYASLEQSKPLRDISVTTMVCVPIHVYAPGIEEWV